MKYRLKPYVVDAEQFFVGKRPHPSEVCFCVEARGFAHVHTAKGIRRIQSGDWILKSATGAVYTESAARFLNRYEAVEVSQ